MIEKRGGSFHVSEEAAKRVTPVELSQQVWFKTWLAEQQLTDDQRRARIAEQRRQHIAKWRAARANHRRVTPTLELLMAALCITQNEAEHYVQPYCTCDYPLDSETGSHCDFYDLDMNPPQEDTP